MGRCGRYRRRGMKCSEMGHKECADETENVIDDPVLAEGAMAALRRHIPQILSIKLPSKTRGLPRVQQPRFT